MALDRQDAQPTHEATLASHRRSESSDADASEWSNEPKQADGAVQRASAVLLALGPSLVRARARPCTTGLPTVKCPFPFINEPTNANGSFSVRSVRLNTRLRRRRRRPKASYECRAGGGRSNGQGRVRVFLGFVARPRRDRRKRQCAKERQTERTADRQTGRKGTVISAL